VEAEAAAEATGEGGDQAAEVGAGDGLGGGGVDECRGARAGARWGTREREGSAGRGTGGKVLA
jgi:hypothetical protein